MRLVDLLLVLLFEGRTALPKSNIGTTARTMSGLRRLDSAGERSHRHLIDCIRSKDTDALIDAIDTGGEWKHYLLRYPFNKSLNLIKPWKIPLGRMTIAISPDNIGLLSVKNTCECSSWMGKPILYVFCVILESHQNIQTLTKIYKITTPPPAPPTSQYPAPSSKCGECSATSAVNCR